MSSSTRRRLARTILRHGPLRVGAPLDSLRESQWQSRADLEALQADLRGSAASRDGRSSPAAGRTISSSGTGGSATSVRWDVEAMRWHDASEERAREWAGVGGGRSRVWVCCNPGDRLRRLGAFVSNTRLVAAGDVARDEPRFRALVDDLASRPPEIVQGVSNVLAALARELVARGITLSDTVCLSAGNHLTPWYRRALEAAFAAPARERYAVSEVGLIAAACEVGTLHVNAETLLVEALDESGAPVPPGTTGTLAVTMLRNRRGTARRLVGDVGRLVEVPCACGRGLPVLELAGRVSEQLALPGGLSLAPRDLFSAADEPGVLEASFRYVPGAATLEVSACRNPRGASFDTARLESLVGPETRVVVKEVPKLEPAPSGKLALVTQCA